MPDNAKTVGFTIRLPKDLHEELDELKYLHRTSAQQLILQAIREFLERNIA